MNDAKHKFIIENLKELIRDAGSRLQKKQPVNQVEPTLDAALEGSSDIQEDVAPSLSVLCVPARSEADEIAALLLSQVLVAERCLAPTVPVTSLADELVELIERLQPDVICISATPPAAVMHARYLCQRLRDRFPKLRLIVGLWDLQGALDKARERIGCDATVVATLASAQDHIRLLIPPYVPDVQSQSQPESAQLIGATAE
jgi:hypothetical protein